MLGGSATNSAIDMLLLVDGQVSSNLLYWLSWFLPLLDLELTLSGFGTNSSCENRFSLVKYEDNAGYQIYSKANTTGFFQPIENIADVLDNWRPVNLLMPPTLSGIPPTLNGIHTALDDIMVEMRPSTRTCLVARNVVVMSSVSFPYPGDEMSVTVEEQLRKYDATLHTFMQGNSFSFKGGFVGIGRTMSTGYADLPLSTCVYSAPLSGKPDSAGTPTSNISTIALNIGGSVWQLLPGSEYTATSCAFQEVIIKQMKRRIGSCFYCQCSSSGEENCVAAGSQEEECRCEGKGGKVRIAIG